MGASSTVLLTSILAAGLPGAGLKGLLLEPSFQRSALERSEAVVLPSGQLRIEVLMRPGHSAAPLSAQLRARGALIEVELEGALQARLDPALAWWVSAQPEVHRARFVSFPRPEAITSEGLSMMGIARAHEEGLTGEGVHILIIDSGFLGYEALLGTELPASVDTFSLAKEGFDAQETDHGTKCAQIIHDIAPGARLTLATAETQLEWAATFEWASQQTDLHIVSVSHGWDDNYPLDGTSLISTAYNEVALAGKLAIKSAGNRGNKMVTVPLTDANQDGRADLGRPEDGLLPLYANSGDSLNVDLRWNEPFGAASLDLSLCLLDENFNVLTCADETQDGAGDPTERAFWSSPQVGPHFAEVRCDPAQGCPPGITVRISTSQWRESELADLNIAFTRAGSISAPGDGPDVLTVGAIGYAKYYREVTPYSSEGPTDDGRTKPEIFGPSHISTERDRLEDGAGFTGTSAAAPHVAGLAALKLQAQPQLSATQLRQALISDVDSDHYGALFGSGLAFYQHDQLDCREVCRGRCGSLRGCNCGGCGLGSSCDDWRRCIRGRPEGDACALGEDTNLEAGACRGDLLCLGDTSGDGVCEWDFACSASSYWRNWDCVDGLCKRSYCFTRCDFGGGCPADYEPRTTSGGTCYCRPDSWACVPDCEDRECGPDRCGQSCGTCEAGRFCDATGRCACESPCEGRSCGPDPTCPEVSCGACDAGFTCTEGQCECAPSCEGVTCGMDPVCGELDCGACPAGQACEAGACVCQPSCEGVTCGPDGCGGNCGSGPCPPAPDPDPDPDPTPEKSGCTQTGAPGGSSGLTLLLLLGLLRRRTARPSHD